LNLENFQLLKDTRDKLIDVFCQGKKNSIIRQLDLSLVSRVRILTSLSWNDRIVSIKKGDTLLFESKEYDYQGTISDNCAGDWSKEKKAVIGILDQNENSIFIDGEWTKSPVANFLIKYVEPPESKNVIEIISALRKYQADEEVTNAFSNCVSDLNIPINSKVVVDETKKPVTISNSFQVEPRYANSTNTDDFLIKIQHSPTEIENNSPYEIEILKGAKGTDDLIVEQWVRKSKKVVAIIDGFSNADFSVLSKLKIGEEVEAKIKRQIFNIKNNGARETVGFVASIEGYNYTLPIENISIELQNDFLKQLIGQKIILITTGVTNTTHQPIFSIIPVVEKERQDLVKLNEVNGIVAKITGSKVFFTVRKDNGKFTHLVGIPTGFIKDNMKYLEVGGDVSLKVKLRNDGEGKITIDCLDDEDLTFEEVNELGDLLSKVKKSSEEYLNFTRRNIQINEVEISTETTISFEHFNELSHLYPILHFSLRKLYASSWELDGFLSGIKKAFDELFIEVSKMKSKAKSTDYRVMQENLKQFKWHNVKLSELHNTIIKSEVDKIWEITRKQSDIDYRKNKLIPKFRNDLENLPDYQTNRRASINQKIYNINLEISLLEAEIKRL
jgi:predicted RNA-binding protein with RPS1 domain